MNNLEIRKIEIKRAHSLIHRSMYVTMSTHRRGSLIVDFNIIIDGGEADAEALAVTAVNDVASQPIEVMGQTVTASGMSVAGNTCEYNTR